MQTQKYKEQLHAPFEWYRTMRATQPVFQHHKWGGWQVLRYDDVSRVLNEYATFSSDSQRMAQAEGSQGEPDPIGSSILQMDPSRHRQLRNIVTQAFTPRMVAQLEPRITAMLDRLPVRWQLAGMPLDMVKSFVVFGAKQLPMTWDA